MEKTKVEIVFQVGCVVNSVDQVLENLRTYFELEEETIVIKSSKERAEQGIRVENTYNGRPADFHIKTARLNFGGIDLEYVEPLNKDGGDPYSDWLKEHGPGIHHINMKLADRSIIDRIMAEKNIPIHILSKTGGLELETYDFRQMFGFCELGIW
ncbi:MAG: hypothetical protein ACLVC2_02020 [Emergencia timonensis]